MPKPCGWRRGGGGVEGHQQPIRGTKGWAPGGESRDPLVIMDGYQHHRFGGGEQTPQPQPIAQGHGTTSPG